jgi:hypothetical protein
MPKSNSGWLKPSSTPGPGSYEPKLQESSEYNSVKMPKDPRKPYYDEKKNIPGPGSYSTPIEKSVGYK